MTRQLPPLNAMRAFEAAARHLSITKAAGELCVTTAAISHQVKVLEDYLGIRLFRRHNRTISLTEAGQACLPELRKGFDHLSNALQHLDGVDAFDTPTLNASSSLAEKWLAPADMETGIPPEIAERERARNSLPANELHLRMFVEHCPAPVVMFDRDMRYLVASRRWLAHNNCCAQDVIGHCYYLVFPQCPERWKEAHRRALAGEVVRCEQDSYPRSDGTTDWVRWEARPWWGVDGEIGGIIMFAEVVTQHVRTRQAL